MAKSYSVELKLDQKSHFLITKNSNELRMGHRANFRGKNKCFVHVLFPVCAILCGILTSGILRARLIIEIRFTQLTRAF